MLMYSDDNENHSRRGDTGLFRLARGVFPMHHSQYY